MTENIKVYGLTMIFLIIMIVLICFLVGFLIFTKPFTSKRVEKFMNTDYSLKYFKENRESFKEITDLIKYSKVNEVRSTKSGYELKNGCYLVADYFGEDDVIISEKIADKMKTNNYDSLIRMKLDNLCVLYKVLIVSTINTSVSYIFSENKECLLEEYEEDKKYSYIYRSRLKIDDNWLFEYNNIPSL